MSKKGAAALLWWEMKLAGNVTSDNKEHQEYKEMVPGPEQEKVGAWTLRGFLRCIN